MQIENYERQAEILKIMGHPARLCILVGLLNKDNEGCNVTYMQKCLGIPQSTISQHLAKLKSHGIIKGRRYGLNIEYRVCDETVIEILKTLKLC